MKKTVFALFVALIALTSACNQGSKNNSDKEQTPASPEAQARVDRQLERLNETLDLSEEQEIEIRKILIAASNDMQKMREEMRNGGGDFEGMREQMRQNVEIQNEKMKKILSDDQWVEYEKIMEEMRSRRGQGRRGGEDRNE